MALLDLQSKPVATLIWDVRQYDSHEDWAILEHIREFERRIKEAHDCGYSDGRTDALMDCMDKVYNLVRELKELE
jgi:hypothetical protein